MRHLAIAAIALSNRDYPDLAAKLAEAVGWLEHAARMGADLAVLPEGLNYHRGDGTGTVRAADIAFDDWRAATAPLADAARRLNLAVTVPVLERRDGRLRNCFHLLDRRGEEAGCYVKRRLTPGERAAGLQAGGTQPFQWEGIAIGGAICFDTNFQEVFDDQWRQGARLFLVPSLWPGGDWLDHYARRYSCPIALAYPAWSRILGADGRELAAGGYRHETLRFGHGAPVVLARVNLDTLVVHADGHQHLMVEIQRRWGAAISISFDQKNCLFTLASEHPDCDLTEVRSLYGLLPLQDYLAQASNAPRG